MNILVIGGTSGIGQACAVALAEDNMVVAPHKDQLDVTDPRIMGLFFAQKNPSHFDGLVYSAGINYLAWSDGVNDKSMLDTFDVNVFGFIRLLRYMAPKRTVVIGSDAADMPMNTSIVYNASKAALHAATRVAAKEAVMHGGRVNIVAPGKISGTDMTKYVERRTQQLRNWPPEQLVEYEMSKMSLKRYGKVEEVAAVVKWLMLEAPDYINGETIKVNGGR